MAQTPSNMLPLGTIAPTFNLPDVVTGQNLSLEDARSDKATVIMFICNHCPFVIHVQEEMVRIAEEYGAQGVSFIAISANDVDNYPQDAPDKMKAVALENGYSFPYLYDETQEVAKAYDAACTPDFYLFDGDRKLFYRGRMDGSRPGNEVPVTGEDLRTELDNILAGKPASVNQLPSIGCNIKWK